LPKRLRKASQKELHSDYGYSIVKTKVRHLVKRPSSEVAEAIAQGRLSSAIYGTAAISTLDRPDLEVISGGSASADAH
jgi:hypothetical protein